MPHTCTPFRLSSGGLINIGSGTIITLTQDAAFQPGCPGTSVPQPIDPLETGVDLSVLDGQDPFYSSTNPQLYAIASATIVSYMLLVILFITPRTFFVGGAGGGGGFLGQRGMISGAYGSNSVIGIGTRPWLQKLAALTVAVSLTIVTADSFKWAELQYDDGYQDAAEVSQMVNDGLEIRVVRVISETFLWLAQAQTLIRLFPRHKEKLMIKWIAFGLITFELIFSALNHFLDEGVKHHPGRFVNAIPALNYLLALALNLCYGAFVFYYAMCKRRFAFFHAKMRNMPLVALLSLTSVLIPVIFFILDLSSPNVAGWGSYVRWVGAAAASVVVWEWVERIEALERDEKKDGILGREIFDGDEMLESSPSSEFSWPRSRKKDKGGGGSEGRFGSMSTGWGGLTTRAREIGRTRLLRQRNETLQHPTRSRQISHLDATNIADGEDEYLKPPAPVASPVSRADTTSAASTVYMVRYHPVGEQGPPIAGPHSNGVISNGGQRSQNQASVSKVQGEDYPENSRRISALTSGLSRIPNPFKRQRTSPPLEVAQALSSSSNLSGIATSHHASANTGLLQRLHVRRAPKINAGPESVIVVPAPQRRRPSFSNDMSNDHDCVDTEIPELIQTAPDPIALGTANDGPPEAVLNAINNSPPPNPAFELSTVDLSKRGTVLISDVLASSNLASVSPIASEGTPHPPGSQRHDNTYAQRTDHDR